MQIDLPEGLRFVELTVEKAVEMWNRMNDISGLFDDYTKGNFESFRANVESPNSLWLETTQGDGLLYLLDIVRGLSASAHFIFWDRKLKGKEELCKAALRFAMTHIPLVKVNVFLPDYATHLNHFIKRLGFTKEGMIRRWSISNGRLFDVYVYGITYEEAIEDGTIHESADYVSGGQGVHRPSAGLFRQPEHPRVGPANPGRSSDNELDKPDAESTVTVRPPDRELPVGADGGTGAAEHRRSDEPVPAETGD